MVTVNPKSEYELGAGSELRIVNVKESPFERL